MTQQQLLPGICDIFDIYVPYELQKTEVDCSKDTVLGSNGLHVTGLHNLKTKKGHLK